MGMEVGPNGQHLAARAAARHPVDQMQRSIRHPYRDLTFARRVYGSGLAMTLATEQKNAAHESHSLGLPSSGVYSDIVMGNDVKIDFSDFLSLPENRPDIKVETLHTTMNDSLGCKLIRTLRIIGAPLEKRR